MQKYAWFQCYTVLLLVLMLVRGCGDSSGNAGEWNARLLDNLAFTDLRGLCKRLCDECGSHEVALQRLSDDAKVRYLFCMRTDMDADLLDTSIGQLRFGSIGSIQDLFSCRDAVVLRELRDFRHSYFAQRYPGNYFGTEDATNLEFEHYARRVIDEFMHHYSKYDKEGKIALARLVHDTLTYPANWKYVPEYMRHEFAAYIMNLVPQSGNNATIEPPEPWLRDSGVPVLAIELVSQTGDERFINDVLYFIKLLARNTEERNRGFQALRRLKAKGDRAERFLVEALHNEAWKDSRWDITDAMACTQSPTLAKHLLPFIGGKDHRLWSIAAHTYWRLPDFKERVAALPRDKQVQVFLMAQDKTDTTRSNESPMNRITQQDAQVLVNTFDLNALSDFVCVARQSMYLFREQQNRRTVAAVIVLLDELTRSGEAQRLWLLFGYGVQYLERVSGHQFWDPSYSHGATGQTKTHKHTAQELQETMTRIHKWWNKSKADFPAQLEKQRK
ncbi:MAG: hypothetical protein ACYS8I_04260 [Planctomycetota bacterium]|jgi:hypothetical protein